MLCAVVPDSPRRILSDSEKSKKRVNKIEKKSVEESLGLLHILIVGILETRLSAPVLSQGMCRCIS